MDKSEEKFYEIYYKNILPKLETLEPERKQMLNILNKSASDSSQFKEFKKLVKSICTKDFENELSIKWNNQSTRKKISIEKSNIFPKYNKIEYDDAIQGIYKDTEFYVQEMELLWERKKEPKTVFKGIAICIHSNKTVKVQTIVTSKNDTATHNRLMPIPMMFILSMIFLLLGISVLITILKGVITEDITRGIFGSIASIVAGIRTFYLAVRQIKYEQKLQNVKLEDLNFGKRFNVYSEDQIEARFLVTPAFMDRLQNLQTAFGTRNIKCSFFDDKIIFAISTSKDLFEIGNLFVPLTDKRQIETFYKELISIYNMIDYFKLTEKTGL